MFLFVALYHLAPQNRQFLPHQSMKQGVLKLNVGSNVNVSPRTRAVLSGVVALCLTGHHNSMQQFMYVAAVQTQGTLPLLPLYTS